MAFGADSLFPLFRGKLDVYHKIKEGVSRMTNIEDNEFLRKENTELKSMIDQLNATVSRLAANSESQEVLIQQQIQLINALTKTIDELKAQIAKLEEQKNKNSHNSSKPPSSDGFKRFPPNSRKPSGKKAGGQKGHTGSALQITAKPDETVEYKPSACEHCPLWDQCRGNACTAETRNVVDISVKTIVIAHKTLEIPSCPLSGSCQRGEFPGNIRATIQYGDNLQALVTSLNTVGAVSVNRTHEILMGVFNIPIATGTVSNTVHRVAEAVTPAYDQIGSAVVSSDLAHFDETSTRLDGKTVWVHVASNAEYTYLDVSRKRGVDGMNQCGVLPLFHGVAVHDCWTPYWKYTEVGNHAVCCAHILRELTGVIENSPSQIWAKSMKKLLLKMKQARDNAVGAGKEKLSDSYLKQLSGQYDRIIRIGKFQNPIPEPTWKKRGRRKKGRILALIERLETLKASVCLFLNDFSVPFDNNQAERDLRMVKTKTKVSGCFRSEDGARDYLKIMSYIGTAHKGGLNAYDAIREALTGNPEYIFQ